MRTYLVYVASAAVFLIIYANIPVREIVAPIQLSPCSCSRPRPQANLTSSLSDTTCSEYAHARGGGQKVVAFSFYEKDDDMSLARLQSGETKGNVNGFFFNGVQINIDLMSKHYPGWTIRIYHDIDEKDPLTQMLCEFACKYDFVDLCNARHVPADIFKESHKIFPLIWRFFPTMDPQVDFLVSRDLDSRISAREEAAVSEWVESGLALHAMRDHPWHPVPMLGGGWGARLTDPEIRQYWISSWSKILKDQKAYATKKDKGQDQDILRYHIWNPWGSKSCLQHDSYCCKRFPGSKGFPTQRIKEEFNFFGSVGGVFWEECPMECRREGHKDWVYC